MIVFIDLVLAAELNEKNIDSMKKENFQLKINGEIAMLFTGILIDILKIYKII